MVDGKLVTRTNPQHYGNFYWRTLSHRRGILVGAIKYTRYYSTLVTAVVACGNFYKIITNTSLTGVKPCVFVCMYLTGAIVARQVFFTQPVTHVCASCMVSFVFPLWYSSTPEYWSQPCLPACLHVTTECSRFFGDE